MMLGYFYRRDEMGRNVTESQQCFMIKILASAFVDIHASSSQRNPIIKPINLPHASSKRLFACKNAWSAMSCLRLPLPPPPALIVFYNFSSFKMVCAMFLYCQVPPSTFLNWIPCRLNKGTFTTKISNLRIMPSPRSFCTCVDVSPAGRLCC